MATASKPQRDRPLQNNALAEMLGINVWVAKASPGVGIECRNVSAWRLLYRFLSRGRAAGRHEVNGWDQAGARPDTGQR